MASPDHDSSKHVNTNPVDRFLSQTGLYCNITLFVLLIRRIRQSTGSRKVNFKAVVGTDISKFLHCIRNIEQGSPPFDAAKKILMCLLHISKYTINDKS
jgi:hypothetical protein